MYMWPIWPTSLNVASGFPCSLEGSVEARERKRIKGHQNVVIKKERKTKKQKQVRKNVQILDYAHALR